MSGAFFVTRKNPRREATSLSSAAALERGRRRCEERRAREKGEASLLSDLTRVVHSGCQRWCAGGCWAVGRAIAQAARRRGRRAADPGAV